MKLLIYFIIHSLSVKYAHSSPSTNMFRMVTRYFGFMFGPPLDANPDTLNPRSEYDFVIVGAGAAGCALAARLSENSNFSVLLLEAGGDENSLTDVPMFFAYVTGTPQYTWRYFTQKGKNEFCKGMKLGRCHWPRGKGEGGSTIIHDMVYSRGFPSDYDEWANMGHEGWSWKDVKPYFLKSEDVGVQHLRSSDDHHTGGELKVEHPPWRSPIAPSFIEACEELGYPVVDNTNGAGCNYVLATMSKGIRWSSAKAFLRPARFRKNLHVSKQSMVTKVLLDKSGNVATGVRYVKDGKKRTVKALKEVVLSAGVINTPQLLMLSGIGPAKHLWKLKLPVFKDLPVGENLQDHVSMTGLVFTVNSSVTIIESRYRNLANLLQWANGQGGPLTVPGGAEASLFTGSGNHTTAPDVELIFTPGALTGDSGRSLTELYNLDDAFYNKTFGKHLEKDAFAIVPIVLRPKSRGFMRLKSANPLDPPLFYPNYYQHEDDVRTMIRGIREAIRFGESKPFQKYGAKLSTNKMSGCEDFQFNSDEYWNCAARHLTTNLHHQVGTCAMGSVVDEQLRVYGVRALRVVDASVAPVIPAGHTNAMAIMIGEKGADMIKNSWLE